MKRFLFSQTNFVSMFTLCFAFGLMAPAHIRAAEQCSAIDMKSADLEALVAAAKNKIIDIELNLKELGLAIERNLENVKEWQMQFDSDGVVVDRLGEALKRAREQGDMETYNRLYAAHEAAVNRLLATQHKLGEAEKRLQEARNKESALKPGLEQERAQIQKQSQSYFDEFKKRLIPAAEGVQLRERRNAVYRLWGRMKDLLKKTPKNCKASVKIKSTSGGKTAAIAGGMLTLAGGYASSQELVDNMYNMSEEEFYQWSTSRDGLDALADPTDPIGAFTLQMMRKIFGEPRKPVKIKTFSGETLPPDFRAIKEIDPKYFKVGSFCTESTEYDVEVSPDQCTAPGGDGGGPACESWEPVCNDPSASNYQSIPPQSCFMSSKDLCEYNGL